MGPLFGLSVADLDLSTPMVPFALEDGIPPALGFSLGSGVVECLEFGISVVGAPSGRPFDRPRYAGVSGICLFRSWYTVQLS